MSGEWLDVPHSIGGRWRELDGTVGDLREALADLPADLPVTVGDGEDPSGIWVWPDEDSPGRTAAIC